MNKEKEIQFWQFAAPMTFLVAYVFATPFSIANDFYILGMSGIFFSARWKLPGAVFSLFAVLMVGFVKHGIFNEHHLWRWALEGSLACSFLMVALAFEDLQWKWMFSGRTFVFSRKKTYRAPSRSKPLVAIASQPVAVEVPEPEKKKSAPVLKYWERRAQQDRQRLQDFLAEMDEVRNDISQSKKSKDGR